MSTTSNKRPRTARTLRPFSAQEMEVLRAKFAALPVSTLQSIALDQPSSNPGRQLMRTIDDTYDKLLDQNRTQIDFNHYSKEAGNLLNRKYASISLSQQNYIATDVIQKIGHMLDQIVNLTTENSFIATKFSAVETVREIMMSACLVGAAFGREARDNCDDWDNKLYKVLKTFSAEELELLFFCDVSGVVWIAKLCKLVAHSDADNVWPRLGKAFILASRAAREAGGG